MLFRSYASSANEAIELPATPNGDCGTNWSICLTKEHNMNYVRRSFREDIMFRAVVEETAALASITLFLGMIAVWAQVISAL